MSAVLQHRRTVLEDSILLPSAAKVGVVALTFISDVTHSLAVEETIAALCVTLGLLLSTVGWWYSVHRFRTTGAALLVGALFVPLILGPDAPRPPHSEGQPVPAISKSNPLRFPEVGRVARSDLLSTAADGFFREQREPHRVIMLRGVNFGASTKIPSASHATHLKPTDFYSGHRDVSFVSRPCPLEEADEHFARLASWGFNVVRLLITWEAVEHAGPGKYDYAYLDYLKKLCRKAAAHGISVFIDPHQDVWSRFTGGDGE